MERPSAIPRPKSRLPLPTSSFNRSLKASPSRERLRTDSGLDVRRLHRPSQERLLPRKPSYPLIGLEEQPGEDYGEVVSSGGWISSPTVRRGEHQKAVRRDTSSLSDRTVDTLSRVSPAPPSRSTSPPYDSSRPSSRQESLHDSLDFPGSDGVSNAGSTGSSTFRSSHLSVAKPSNLRSNSSTRPTTGTSQRADSQNRLSLRQSSLPSQKQNRFSTASAPPTRTSQPRQPTKSRPPVNRQPRRLEEDGHADDTFSGHNDAMPASRPQSEVYPRAQPKRTVKTKTVRRSAPPPAKRPTSSDADGDSKPSSKPTKSSSALRESIAKAKAAARKAAQAKKTEDAPELAALGVDLEDPFNQKPKGAEAEALQLKKKADIGRATGHLNIAGLGLKDIPQEVMTMYDYDPEVGGDWAESVDLIRLVAADNEFETLSDSAFPDIDYRQAMEDPDFEGSCLFGGLEILDLHRNALVSLPQGLRRLERLRSLNLSDNKLPMDVFGLLAQLESLIDLKIASNGFKGMLTPSVGNLSRLEALDLKGNALTELPEELSSLSSLRILDVSENQLTQLPFDALSSLPLVELNAKKNKLRGDLLPPSIERLDKLQSLTLTGNALERLTSGHQLSLPSLKHLLIGGNRITALPDMSSWTKLVTLIADDNKLSEFPGGFTELHELKIADFTGNDIRRLPEQIGLMEKLSTFTVTSNPLMEKKYLTMETEQIKLDLRGKLGLEKGEHDSDDESVQTFFTLPDEGTPTPEPKRAEPERKVQIKPGGLLDLSSQDLDNVDPACIEALAQASGIQRINISHNRLHAFPTTALSIISESLHDLNLSFNQLDSANIITSTLSLPNLRSLNISHTGCSSLEALLNNLSAPSLETLDISHNRLTGALPVLKEAFPSLTSVVAAGNKLQSITYEAVEGLRTVDVNGNDIDSLPPRIGLLTGEGGLQQFDVAGNTFRVPRWQVVEKGTAAILEWLRGRITDEQMKEWTGQDVQRSNEEEEEAF